MASTKMWLERSKYYRIRKISYISVVYNRKPFPEFKGTESRNIVEIILKVDEWIWRKIQEYSKMKSLLSRSHNWEIRIELPFTEIETIRTRIKYGVEN